MPISLSVGDILALSNLALQIAKSLRDSTGSSAEFQALIDDFHSLSQTLAIIYEIAKSGSLKGLPFSKELANLVFFEISQCRSVMEDFQRDLKRYEGSLGSKGTNSRRLTSLRVIWYKVFWALFKKQDVVDVRTKIAERRGMITLLMTVLNARIGVDEGPRTVGYTLENAVRVVDIFGEGLTLPWQLCVSWEKFSDIMKAHLRGSAGERFINRGDYNVSYSGGKQIIKPREWPTVVHRGMKVEVRIIVRRGEDYGIMQTCPRCPGSGVRVSAEGDWIDCPRCHGRFRISENGENDEEIVSPEVERVSNIRANVLETDCESSGQGDDDIGCIPNIHLIVKPPLTLKPFMRKTTAEFRALNKKPKKEWQGQGKFGQIAAPMLSSLSPLDMNSLFIL